MFHMTRSGVWKTRPKSCILLAGNKSVRNRYYLTWFFRISYAKMTNWHPGKWKHWACCPGSTVLTSLHTHIFEGRGEQKFFRWLIFSKEKLRISPMVAKQFLFLVLQMISAYIPLFLVSSIFVPAAPSGKLSSLGYYTPKILTNSPQIPTQHGPARRIKETCRLCWSSAIGAMPQSVPPAWPRGGH